MPPTKKQTKSLVRAPTKPSKAAQSLSLSTNDDYEKDDKESPAKTQQKLKQQAKKQQSIDDIDGIDNVDDVDGIDGIDDDASSLSKAEPKAKYGAFTILDPLSSNHDYYDIFNIERKATKDEIIKSYKILALEYHPDRNMGKKDVQEKFAKISQIHQTLIDPRKRKLYDNHGELQNTDMSEGFLSAYDLFRQTCPNVTPDDTELFKAKYLDTEEEYTDVVAAFEKTQGNLFLMMQGELFFSEPETHKRDHDMVEMLIKRGDIKNQDFITTFYKTSPTAVADLVKFREEEAKEYNKLYAEATLRAKKKAPLGRVTQSAIDNELHSLILQKNGAGKGADTLENIALSLSTLAGHDGLGLDTIDAKAAKLSTTKSKSTTSSIKSFAPSATTKGGRTSGKSQKNQILTDLSRDLAHSEKTAEKKEMDALADALSVLPNPKKRTR